MALLPSVELPTNLNDASLQRAGVLGEIAVVINSDYSAVKGLVKQLVESCEARVNLSALSVDDAIELLNSGASKIVFDLKPGIEDTLVQLPKDRVAISVDFASIGGVSEPIKASAGGICIKYSKVDVESVTKAKVEFKSFGEFVIFLTEKPTTAEISALSKLGVKIQFFEKNVDIADAVSAVLVSDRPDGLFPTVVVDEQGVALGFVYSSAESIKESIKSKQGIYQSRKRGLWRKGETSGATQSLIKISLDCDNDTVCFVVKQHGSGFCHVPGQWTCFGESGGLGRLMRTLQSRKDNPVEGSYANKLFNDQNLLSAKVREEAEELNVASASGIKKDIAAEAADVIYFTLTTAVKGGVSLKDIEAELDKRAKRVTRRKGDAKPWALNPLNNPVNQVSPEPKAPEKPKSTAFSCLKEVSQHSVLASEKADPTDPFALKVAREIFEDVRKSGFQAVMHHAKRLGDIKEGDKLVLTQDEMKAVYDKLPTEQQQLLQRSVARVKLFAQAQRDSIQDLTTPIEGGNAGHTISPVERAGCYAPGGRFPLPSSVIMTAVTARVAGVQDVWVASPRPTPITIGAAYASNASSFLCIGGAQAIAALALGAGPDIPACDAIVGPGNKFVTAAKSLASGIVKIDMLAGPSEVLIIADSSCDPAIVAADMLAQCEHDVDAMSVLVTIDCPDVAQRVQAQLIAQLEKLETREIASASLTNNSYFVNVKTLEEAIQVSDKIGPEHLELHIKNSHEHMNKPLHYGSLFIGENSAEVLGDYCAGPNHVLPTRGTSRYVGGLSVFTFLRIRTWSKMDPFYSQSVVEDAESLGKLEGLVGHANAARLRKKSSQEKDKLKRNVNELIYEKYLRPDFHSLPQYVPVKPLDVLAAEIGVPMEKLVKLNANENNYGPHPLVLQSLASASSVHHIYPDPSQTYLRQAIAQDLGVSADCIVAGSGADDLLDVVIRLAPDHRPIIISNPTFGMYSFLAKIYKHRVIDVPRKPQHEVDIDEIIRVAKKTHAAIIFVTTPNNPTGNVVKIPDIFRLLNETDNCLVIVDEAYIQFAVDPSNATTDTASSMSVVRHVIDYPNLIVMHTFSKWAALAGLRVGYSVSHPIIGRAIDAVKQPYNVNSAADAAARAALKNKAVIVKEQVHAIINERDNLYKLLNKYSWLKPYPDSKSNFILMKVVGKPAWLVNQILYGQGCLIRYYSTSDLQSCIRISVGTPDDTKKLESFLDKLDSKDFLADYVKETEAILWDMDGVIANVGGSYRAAIIETCKSFGITIDNTDIDEMKARGNANNDWKVSLNLIKDRKKNTSDKIPTLEEVTAKFEELYHGTPSTPGLHHKESLITPPALLESLSKKYKMAVVTGRPRKDCKIFMDRFDLHKYFSVVVCMEDTPLPKPDAGPCIKALNSLGVKKAVMIGDTPDDITSANLSKIGAIGALVVPGSNKDKSREAIFYAGAMQIITDINDLTKIF